MKKIQALIKNSKQLFVLSLVVVIVASIFANMINTSFYSVDVKRISFTTEKGVLSGLLYLPKGASADDPRATIVTTHGYLNSAEMQDAPAIELSKRGYVVLALDMYEQGHSMNKLDKTNSSAFFSFWPTALFDAVQYIYAQPYVLKDFNGNGMIAVSGHSMGSFSSVMAVVMDEQQFATTGIRKIHASLAVASDYLYTGYLGVNAATANAMYGSRVNGIIAAHFDEFFFDSKAEATGDTMIYKDYVQEIDGRAFLGNPSSPTAGKWYTLPNGGTRIIYTPYETHPWNHFSIETTGNQIDFYNKAFDSARSANMIISSGANQTWFWKEIFEFIALLGFFIMFMPLANLLLTKTKAFSGLNNPTETLVAGPKTGAQKALYWLIIAFSAFFPAYFFPTLMDKQADGLALLQKGAEVVMVFAVVMLIITYVKDKGKSFSKIGAAGLAFFGALTMRYMATDAGKLFVQSAWFNQPTTNQVVYWAIMCALVAVMIISIIHFFDRSTNPAFDFRSYGVSVTCKQVMLALGLALTLLAAGYALLYTIDYLLVVDFRFWSWAIKTFEVSHVMSALQYAPFFLVYYFFVSIAINLNTNNTYINGWKGYAVAIFMVVGGLVIWMIMQYGSLFTNMVAMEPGQSLNSILLFATIPSLTVATIYAKRLYKMTGNVMTAAFFNTVLFTLITAANTIVYSFLK
ncbi:MAG: hypothetical protein HGB31_07985 [Erysipelotrichaceae bacterium]|nr:hypothetical protein [Erysipelotrichaceae bacterium]